MTPRPTDQPADVLIVDDDAAIRRLAIRALGELDVAVREVGCANDAEEEIRRQTPDLILLDVMMPGINGLEFCGKLRDNDATRDIPVLIMTGQGDLDVLERAYASGATDFLTKPVPPLILRNRVRYLLRSSAAFRELRESRERLADAQSIAHVGNWEFDATSREFIWSEELFRIFGLRPGGRVTADDYFGKVHADDVGAVRAAWTNTLDSGVPHEITYRLCVSGSYERFLSERAEVRVEPGGRRRYVGTIQDITER